MIREPLYPRQFEPIYQYRLRGGRRLADLLTAPLPGDGAIGEAWLLIDRDDHPSKVADGPLAGSTLRELMEASPDQLLGMLAGRFRRFPLLLKSTDYPIRRGSVALLPAEVGACRFRPANAVIMLEVALPE